MRKIIISLVVVAVGLCAYAANWTKITDKIYLDVSGIMPVPNQSNVYSFWTKELNDGNQDFVLAEKSYSQKIWYDLVRYSVDCSSRKIKMNDVLVYGLKNNLIATDSSLGDSWHTVPPDSIVEDYLELVCKTVAEKKQTSVKPQTQPEITQINPPTEAKTEQKTVEEKPTAIDFNAYMRTLQSKVASNWKRPQVEGDLKVAVIFTVSKSGTLVTLSEFKTSGNKEFDTAATDAVKNSVPFEALPESFNGKGVDIQLTFDKTVHGFVLSRR